MKCFQCNHNVKEHSLVCNHEGCNCTKSNLDINLDNDFVRYVFLLVAGVGSILFIAVLLVLYTIQVFGITF